MNFLILSVPYFINVPLLCISVLVFAGSIATLINNRDKYKWVIPALIAFALSGFSTTVIIGKGCVLHKQVQDAVEMVMAGGRIVKTTTQGSTIELVVTSKEENILGAMVPLHTMTLRISEGNAHILWQWWREHKTEIEQKSRK